MTDVTGRVPLLVACEEGTSVEVIALLALATAGGLSVRTPIGLHPLHCAVKNRTGAALRIAEHIVALNPLAVTVTGPRGCHTMHNGCAFVHHESSLLQQSANAMCYFSSGFSMSSGLTSCKYVFM